ncbi:unnamed protein product [Leuciscus chuanchicus]
MLQRCLTPIMTSEEQLVVAREGMSRLSAENEMLKNQQFAHSREHGLMGSSAKDLLQEGDALMVDKGFLIKDLLDEIHATLVIPAFLGPGGQFNNEELSRTQNIACSRIHTERAIR